MDALEQPLPIQPLCAHSIEDLTPHWQRAAPSEPGSNGKSGRPEARAPARQPLRRQIVSRGR